MSAAAAPTGARRAAPVKPAGIPAALWVKDQERNGWPAFEPGDVFLSLYLGWIGQAIATFQGRPGVDMKAPTYSHAGVLTSRGQVAEATFPRGRITKLAKFMDARHVFTVYRIPDWTEDQRDRVALAAAELAGRPYDLTGLLGHLVDNLVERLTWNPRKQSGFRPWAKCIGDVDGRARLVCSELVEGAVWDGTAEVVNPGHKVGEARPLDVFTYLRRRGALPVMTFYRGQVVTFPAGAARLTV